MTYPLFRLASSCARFARFRRSIALFLLCLGLCALGHSQNSRYDGIVWSRNGFPSPAASIDVCSQPISTSTTPPYCTPLANLCSSATDAVCASPNPVTADSMGNFHFYVKPGVYCLMSYNSSLSPFQQCDQVLSCPPSSTCTLTILQVGDGTVGAPAYSFTNATSSGWYRAGTNDFRFSIGGVDAFRLNGSFQAIVPPTGMFGFGSSGVTSPDICFTRSAAGTAALGNCTAADASGFLTLTQLISVGNGNTNLAFSGRDATFSTANGAASAGGNLTFSLGSGSNAGGGSYGFTAGNGGNNGAGGGYTFTAGSGGSGLGAGGSFNFTAGNGGATGGNAGSFNFNCGTSSANPCGYQFVGGKVTNYNSIATVSNGIPSEIATVDLTAQTAAVTTTPLYAVPASGAGQYLLQWNAKVTTAAGSSSTLGALTIVYTDPDGVTVTVTAPASIAAGTIATTSAGNTTGTVLLGLPLTLNAKASTNITYAMAYASNAANAMNYNLHIKLVAE